MFLHCKLFINLCITQVSKMVASATPLFSTGRPEVRTEISADSSLPTTIRRALSAIHRQSNSTISSPTSPSSFTGIQSSYSTSSSPSTSLLLSTGRPITAVETVNVSFRTNPDSDQSSAVNSLPFIIFTCVVPPVISAIMIGLIALFFNIRSRWFRKSYQKQNPSTDLFTSSNVVMF